MYLSARCPCNRIPFAAFFSETSHGVLRMSLEPEEDSELRDLVAQSLQSSGVLGKIKVRKIQG